MGDGIFAEVRSFVYARDKHKLQVRHAGDYVNKIDFAHQVQKYGGAYSLLTLYDGYEYFGLADNRGGMAYARHADAFIGASDPAAPLERYGLLLQQFAEFAHQQHKIAIIVAASEASVTRSPPVYSRLPLGEDLGFDLRTYESVPDRVQVAKRLYAHGARILPLDPHTLSPRRAALIDEMVRLWLHAHGFVPLHFLNQVKVWAWSERKRYYVLEQDGVWHSFLSAVPMPMDKGWYFVDIIRALHAPHGSNELLILEAMRLLQGEGAQTVTLGLAPLAGLNVLDSDYPRITRLMAFLFQRKNPLYSFRSLHDFKMKFKPNLICKSYVLLAPRKAIFRAGKAIIETSTNKRAFVIVGLSADSLVDPRKLTSAIQKFMAPDIVLRAFPRRISQWLLYMPGTLTLAFFHVLASLGFLSFSSGNSASGDSSFMITLAKDFFRRSPLWLGVIAFLEVTCGLTAVVGVLSGGLLMALLVTIASFGPLVGLDHVDYLKWSLSIHIPHVAPLPLSLLPLFGPLIYMLRNRVRVLVMVLVFAGLLSSEVSARIWVMVCILSGYGLFHWKLVFGPRLMTLQWRRQ